MKMDVEMGLDVQKCMAGKRSSIILGFIRPRNVRNTTKEVFVAKKLLVLFIMIITKKGNL